MEYKGYGDINEMKAIAKAINETLQEKIDEGTSLNEILDYEYCLERADKDYIKHLIKKGIK